MLQLLTDRASKWFVFAIIILVSVPFALWGLNDYFGGGGGQNAVAKVAGQVITINQFSRAYQNEQARLLSQFGGHLPPGLSDQKIKQMVLQNLVRNKVIALEAQKMGYRITNREVAASLVNFPVFQVKDKFSVHRYREVLRAQGISPHAFESEVRQYLLIQAWEKGIKNTAFITPMDLKQAVYILNEQRRGTLYRIPLTQFSSHRVISSNAIKTYYNQHLKRFKTPLEIRVNYLRIDKANVLALIHPRADELHSFYLKHKNLYQTKISAKIAEITVQLKHVSNSTKEPLNLNKLLPKLRQALVNGENVATLIHQIRTRRSIHYQVRTVQKDQLPFQLRESVFGLKIHQVSPPMRRGDKIYIVKMLRRNSAGLLPYAAVKGKVLTAYKNKMAAQLFNQKMQDLTNLMFEYPNSLNPIAKALHMPVRQSPWLKKQEGDGVWSQSQIIHAAFSQAVKNQHNSRLLHLSSSDVIILHRDALRKPQVMALSRVKEKIKTILRVKFEKQKASAVAHRLMQLLQNNKTIPASLLKWVEITPIDWMTREEDGQNPINQLLFSLGNNKKNAARLTFSASGEPMVIHLTQIRHVPMSGGQKKIISRQLENFYANIEVEVAYQALLKEDHVQIYPNNLGM